jgi:hypothetical protein
MLQYPENLDSLISKIDTINITPCDSARICMVKGYNYYRNENYDKSINELSKAETIFQKLGDNYHTNFNNLIKAFVFELLDLDNNATNLYISCNDYFGKNHLEKYKFYSTLGLLRFSKKLNLDKGALISDINKIVLELNQPIYKGLFYSALGNLEKNDSLKINYYQIAKENFSLTKSWDRVYTQDLNILFAKIRLDSSDKMLQYYYHLSEKYNSYIPTAHQKMKYKYALAYLYTKQGKNNEAIAVANDLLQEPDILKSPDIESYCVNLLSVSYMQLADFKSAYNLLVRDNALLEKGRVSMQNSRLLALGAHYRYTELEREKLDLKVKVQQSLLILSAVSLVFIVVFAVGWFLFKESRHKQEVLKLKNVEIEDQINNLLNSLDSQANRNADLIRQVEELKVEYKDSSRISEFLQAIDKNQITTWMEYEAIFTSLLPGWIAKLKQEVPELSATDLKYCMCLYFNLNNYTISKLCEVGIDAIKSAKKRIRDKFGLDDATEIYVFLKKFE